MTLSKSNLVILSVVVTGLGFSMSMFCAKHVGILGCAIAGFVYGITLYSANNYCKKRTARIAEQEQTVLFFAKEVARLSMRIEAGSYQYGSIHELDEQLTVARTRMAQEHNKLNSIVQHS